MGTMIDSWKGIFLICFAALLVALLEVQMFTAHIPSYKQFIGVFLSIALITMLAHSAQQRVTVNNKGTHNAK